MKVLLTHRFFYPDTPPYALILKRMGHALSKEGHEVHIFASKPSYRQSGQSKTPIAKQETIDTLNIRRCWVFQENKRNPALRAINVLIYCIALFVHILRLRPNIVTASTFPPVFAAWSASLGAKLIGAKFIYHMQDIHPEVSKISGSKLGKGFFFFLLRKLDNQTLRRCWKIITLSKDMEETLCARNLGVLPIHLLNNPSLEETNAQAIDPPANLRKLPQKQRVIFAGNLGNFQNLPLLAEGVATCFETYPNLELMFLGDGAALAGLKAQWEDHPQVIFAPFLPFAQAKTLISEADIGLVSLLPDLYRVAYPSKVATYLDLGLRVLALVEPESHLAKDLIANQQGSIPTSATPIAIGQALETLLQTAPATSKTIDTEDFYQSFHSIVFKNEQHKH